LGTGRHRCHEQQPRHQASRDQLQVGAHGPLFMPCTGGTIPRFYGLVCDYFRLGAVADKMALISI
jgi:hypothetical protein